IKSKIIKQQPILTTIIVGKNAIIDSDIKHQLKEAIGFYDFKFIKINLSSEDEIIQALHENDKNSDIVIISRGGGENLEIFNRTHIAESILNLQSYFISAIGHKEDVPLIQQIADKYFITPTALGQYFRDIYNQTIEELQYSKASIINTITTQLEEKYSK